MEMIKICSVCNNEFTAKSNKANYCGNACRLVAFRNREKHKTNNHINHEQDPNIPEDINERIEALENAHGRLLSNFNEMTVFITKDAISKDTLKYIQSDQNENKDLINKLSLQIDGLTDENKQLRNDFDNVKHELKGLKREFNHFVEDISRNQTEPITQTSILDGISHILNNDRVMNGLEGIMLGKNKLQSNTASLPNGKK